MKAKRSRPTTNRDQKIKRHNFTHENMPKSSALKQFINHVTP